MLRKVLLTEQGPLRQVNTHTQLGSRGQWSISVPWLRFKWPWVWLVLGEHTFCELLVRLLNAVLCTMLTLPVIGVLFRHWHVMYCLRNLAYWSQYRVGYEWYMFNHWTKLLNICSVHLADTIKGCFQSLKMKPWPKLLIEMNCREVSQRQQIQFWPFSLPYQPYSD